MEVKETISPGELTWNGKVLWGSVAFLTLSPIAAFYLCGSYIYQHGLGLREIGLFLGFMWLTGFSITAGYHRLFSHQTYEAHFLVRSFFLIFGAAAFQNSALHWSADHRHHHRFVDKNGDPYNINRGFFYSHIGWVFYGDPEGRNYDNAKDLIDDPLVVWQDKLYWPMALVFGLGLPALVGYFLGSAWAGLIFGGLFRIVFVHHGIFTINSVAHTFGTRPYSIKNTARDCWWLAFISNGEGYHNYHHAFANDYRNGVKWFHWDPTKWLIFLLEKVGLSKNLKRTPDIQILRAQMECSFQQFRDKWPKKEVPSQLESMRASLEAKFQDFQTRYRDYQKKVEERNKDRQKDPAINSSYEYWRQRLRVEYAALEVSMWEFSKMLSLTLRYQN